MATLGAPRAADAPAMAERVEALIALQRVTDARAALRLALAAATAPAAMAMLFPLIPRLADGASCRAAWRGVQRRLDPGAGGLLSLRLRLALRQRDAFLAEAAAIAPAAAGDFAPAIAAAAAALAGERIPAPVFVVGLSKTGTTSLRRALETLDLAAIHWANPLTQALIGPFEATLFDALCDIPVADHVEAFAARHPDARFILTHRPLAPWAASLEAHYRRFHGVEGLTGMRAALAAPEAFPYGARFRAMHARLYARHPDFATAAAAHTARVRAAARGRLLEFDPAEGWAPLCRFLGRPVPTAPFPHDNRSPHG